MNQIRIGKDIKTAKYVKLTSEQRSTHMQIIGASGEGKSKFMEHLIREDIKNKNGLCLIDPHGYLYNDIIKWCTSKGFINRDYFPLEFILFEPSEDTWSFGFNPLKVGSSDISFHVDAMVKAVAKVWGGEDSNKTPLLKRMLRILFHVLAEQELSLLEAYLLISPVQSELRKYITKQIKDVIIREQWEYFNTLRPNQFNEQVGSTINRMMEFLASPIIRNIIGQIENTIDFQEVMDKGKIVLVNLASSDKISEDNAQLLGTLLVNELWQKAKGRPKNSKPFYLYIDECSLFINNDIARILDEGRKFGLHLILAHQHLDQLKRVSDVVYKSVLTDAKTKVVFGGLCYEDAEILVKQMFLGELDLQEYKNCLTKFEVVGYTKKLLKNWSNASGEAKTKGIGSSSASGEGSGTGNMSNTGFNEVYSDKYSYIPLTTSFSSGVGESKNKFSSYMDSFSEVDMETKTRTESVGESESYQPILEEVKTTVYTLQEQIYRAVAAMFNQPPRQFILKVSKNKTQIVIAPFVKDDYVRDDRIVSFKNKCFERATCCQLRENITELINQRHQKLLEPFNKEIDDDNYED